MNTTQKSYSDKLKDPRWQKKRLEILSRDNFTCCLCKDEGASLQIHHKAYSGEPWEAPDNQLITLCEVCHIIVEEMKVGGNTTILCCKKIIENKTVVYSVYKSDAAEISVAIFHYENRKASYITELKKSNIQRLMELINLSEYNEKLLN